MRDSNRDMYEWTEKDFSAYETWAKRFYATYPDVEEFDRDGSWLEDAIGDQWTFRHGESLRPEDLEGERGQRVAEEIYDTWQRQQEKETDE